MIKITNINFEKRTIENVQVNGEDIHDVELRMTKSKFKIVIKNKNETITKEIKKKKAIESVDLVIVEPVKEEIPVVETPVMKEAVMEVIDLAKMKDILKQHIPKQNTLDSYVRTIKDVYEHFKITDMHVLLTTKEQDIIEYIESQYSNSATIKNKLCGFYKAYKILNIQGNLFKQRIDYYTTKNTIDQDETKQDNKKSVEEGDEVLSHFNNKLGELETTIQNDIHENNNSMLNNWSVEVQLYCVLKIYLSIGVMRPSELLNCLITDADCDNTTNYINVTTKQIVINCHKNDLSAGKKVIEINDKKLLGILRKGVGRFLITNNNGELYQSSSAFSKVFRQLFGNCVYDLRKAVSSKCIAEGDIDKIKKLEYVQGHALSCILEFYNIYSKST